jgi:hypothetical protein
LGKVSLYGASSENKLAKQFFGFGLGSCLLQSQYQLLTLIIVSWIPLGCAKFSSNPFHYRQKVYFPNQESQTSHAFVSFISKCQVFLATVNRAFASSEFTCERSFAFLSSKGSPSYIFSQILGVFKNSNVDA